MNTTTPKPTRPAGAPAYYRGRSAVMWQHALRKRRRMTRPAPDPLSEA